MGGAFQTSRDIFKNPIWQDVIKFRIFFFIVGNAVFSQDGVKYGNILVKRGQFLRSFRNLANDLEYLDNRALKRYSISVIKKKVDQLVKEERLKIEETELGTLFTVVNYAMYQGFDHYKMNNREQRENSPRTAREQPENNNKKEKKEEKVKKDNIKHLNQIVDLRSKYSPEINNLIDIYWDVIKKTRKTNQVSDSVVLKTMKQWEKYEKAVIQYSLKKHIESYDDGEHSEKYTLGIMRNTSPEQAQDALNKNTSKNYPKTSQTNIDSRDKEIEFQRWMAEGNDPESFDWETGKGYEMHGIFKGFIEGE